MKAANVTIIEANPAFVADVRKRTEPLVQEWIKSANAKGVDGAKVVRRVPRRAEEGRRRQVRQLTAAAPRPWPRCPPPATRAVRSPARPGSSPTRATSRASPAS